MARVTTKRLGRIHVPGLNKTNETFKGRLAFWVRWPPKSGKGAGGGWDASFLLIKCLGTGSRSDARVLIKAAGSRTNSLEIAVILYFGKPSRAVTRESFRLATNYCIINC